MIVICNIYKSVDDLLPHFYKHYVSLGVTDFAFGIFDGESNPAWNRVSELSFFGLTIHKTSSYQGIIDSQKEKESWIGLVEKFVKPFHDWYIIADLDEFHTIHSMTFPQAAKYCEDNNYDYVSSKLVDRIRSDKIIPETINPNVSIFQQFSEETDITSMILGACLDKVSLVKKDILPELGHHKCSGGISDLKCTTYHFKWFGNLKEKEKEKFKAYKKQGYTHYIENHHTIEMLQMNGGKLI